MRSNGVTATCTTVQEVPRENVFKELPFRSNLWLELVLFCGSVHSAIDRSPIVDHHVTLKALEVREGRAAVSSYACWKFRTQGQKRMCLVV